MSRKHKFYFSFHHWCGLFVGLFMLSMSITGALLVFSDEMTEHINSPYMQVSNTDGKFSVDASFKQLQKQYPGWELRIYDWPKKDEALVYEMRKKDERKRVFVDPVKGNVLHVLEDANATLPRKLILLHYTLFAGATGKVIIMIVGLLFAATLISGVLLYRKSIVKVLSFKIKIHGQTKRAFFSSLHRVVGVWTLLFNIVIVTTGLTLSINIVRNLAKGGSTKMAVKEAKAPPIPSVDTVIARATAEYPDFKINNIRIPAKGDIIFLAGRTNGDPQWYGEFYSNVQYDAQTLKVVKSQWMKKAGFTDRWPVMSSALHFGNYGGIPVKILYCFFGFMPAILSISGFVIWRYRINAKKKNALKKSI